MISVTEPLVTSNLASPERSETVLSLTVMTVPTMPRRRHHLVTGLERLDHFLLLFRALLLRADENEIENNTK